MHWLLTYQGFFFDFDGLLVDTERLHQEAYIVMLKAKGFDLTWDFTTYCHYAHQDTATFAKAMYHLFPALYELEPNWMVLREEKQRIYLDLIEQGHAKLMPGAEELITFLKSHHKLCYVVSNCTKEQALAIKRYIPILNQMDDWITREHYKSPKPSPDGYLLALEKSKLSTSQVVGLEDSAKGLQALKESQILPLLISPKTYPKLESHLLQDTLVFESLSDLLPSSN